MKIVGDLAIAAQPDVRLWGRFRPMTLDATADGGAQIATGPVEVEVGAIPVCLRVPFRAHRVDVAWVGPFRARIGPSDLTVREARAQLRATIEGDEAGIEAGFVGNCRADVKVAGDLHKRREGEDVAAFGEAQPGP
jgi:hypothetical protein